MNKMMTFSLSGLRLNNFQPAKNVLLKGKICNVDANKKI